jgi:uracil-DNA glycosylase family 4
MTPFENGLELVITHLRSCARHASSRADPDVLNRIRRLAEPKLIDRLDPANTVADLESGHLPVKTPSKEASPTHSSTNAQALKELSGGVLGCCKCPHLVAFRHNVVFGVGNPEAELMFVGEAPGADEDLQGAPFVGRAGQLLNRIIQTMGFTRETVYIANVLKCRPDIPQGTPGNRVPTPEEMETCLPYLRTQIEIIRPKVIVALGGTAMRGLLGTTEPMGTLRGRWHSFGSTPLMATFHPSYLMRNQTLSLKRKVWEDMLQVLEKLGQPISARQRSFFLA